MQCYRLRTTRFMENFGASRPPRNQAGTSLGLSALGDLVDEVQLLRDLWVNPVGGHVACEHVVVRLAHQVRQFELFEEHLKQSIQEFIAGLDVPPPDVIGVTEGQRRDEFVYAPSMSFRRAAD